MIIFQPGWFLLFETIAFWLFVSKFGFVPVVASYVAPSFLGVLILAFQSQTALMTLQRKIATGEKPAFSLLNAAGKFFAGLMFVAPFLLTRIIGLILILPGLRHFVLWTAEAWIVSKLAGGAMRGANFVFTNFRASPRYQNSEQDWSEAPREERDVIDITPIEVTHSEVKKKNEP